jgi:protein-L-isoaspartate(D-aspartate) O-methyltransferase
LSAHEFCFIIFTVCARTVKDISPTTPIVSLGRHRTPGVVAGLGRSLALPAFDRTGATAMQPAAADQANQDMVDRLIAQGALWSPALIRAFRATPRHRFLDRIFQYQRKQNRWREVRTRHPGPEELRLVYTDKALITRLARPAPPGVPVPISSSSQPSLMAQMLEDLGPAPGQRILEIGAGTGYNAALMAHGLAPGRVIAIDVDRQVLAEAHEHLRAFPDRPVSLVHADGRAGFPEAAPFDRIMVTAATPDLEPAWLEQLAQGGLLLAPLALAPGLAFVLRGGVREGVFEGRLTRAAFFMPLRGEGEPGTVDEGLPVSGSLRRLSAPWADWFDRRRPRMNWQGFIQALAFYGLLHGHRVSYQVVSDNQPAFGVCDEEQGGTCWLGLQSWHVDGPAGRDLGWTLWRAFLDAGGPWPTEFRLRVSLAGELRPGPERDTYVRQGPRCRQVWQLIETRDRPAWL